MVYIEFIRGGESIVIRMNVLGIDEQTCILSGGQRELVKTASMFLGGELWLLLFLWRLAGFSGFNFGSPVTKVTPDFFRYISLKQIKQRILLNSKRNFSQKIG